MAWRTPPGTGCPQADSLCSDSTLMLAIAAASSGGGQILIREPDAKTPMRKPDADPSSWRLQWIHIHTPDGLADSPGKGSPPSRKLMFRYRLYAGSLRSDIYPMAIWIFSPPAVDCPRRRPLQCGALSWLGW